MQQFEFDKMEEFDTPRVIQPFIAEDERGYVIKDYHQEIFEQNGMDFSLREVFYTKSKQGVIRAVHFQTTYPQEKLVRCISGRIYDVVVDLRIGSETYCKWKGFELYEESEELYIPAGFGHGYLVLEDSIVSYKCNEKFYGEYDSGIYYGDKDLNIDWPIWRIPKIILSEKDKKLQSLKQYEQRQDAFHI